MAKLLKKILFRLIWMKTQLARVRSNLVVTKPDFLEHTGILAKHGFDVINVLKESIKTLYQVEEEEEAENKQTT